MKVFFGFHSSKKKSQLTKFPVFNLNTQKGNKLPTHPERSTGTLHASRRLGSGAAHESSKYGEDPPLLPPGSRGMLLALTLTASGREFPSPPTEGHRVYTQGTAATQLPARGSSQLLGTEGTKLFAWPVQIFRGKKKPNKTKHQKGKENKSPTKPKPKPSIQCWRAETALVSRPMDGWVTSRRCWGHWTTSHSFGLSQTADNRYQRWVSPPSSGTQRQNLLQEGSPSPAS